MPGLFLIRQKRSLFHGGDTPKRNAGFIHGMAQEHTEKLVKTLVIGSARHHNKLVLGYLGGARM